MDHKGKTLSLGEAVEFVLKNLHNITDQLEVVSDVNLSVLEIPKMNKDDLLTDHKTFLLHLYSSLRRMPIISVIINTFVQPIYKSITKIVPFTHRNLSFQESVDCFDGLGCLVTDRRFYDPVYRPINVRPFSPQKINTHLAFFSRRQTTGVTVTPHNIRHLRNTTYDPKLPIKFIIHGYQSSNKVSWVKELSEALLYHGNYNIVLVDWSEGTRVGYHQAMSNMRVVALEVVMVIKWMHGQMGQTLANVHLIGHSLGAHLAGSVGSQVAGIGRITGLDPARPFFQNVLPVVRLDHTDASFVDIIHTDTQTNPTTNWRFGGFGLEEVVGHVDFYPNGGQLQPDCSHAEESDAVDGESGSEESRSLYCNHGVAAKLFIASLLGTCTFQAFPCSSFQEYQKGSCFSCRPPLGCASLGINADAWSPNGHSGVKMFLSTFKGPAFCKYHYNVTIHLGDVDQLGGSVRGSLNLTLITPLGDLEEFNLSPDSTISLKRGSTKSFLLDHHQDLSASKDVLVSWRSQLEHFFNHQTVCASLCSTDLEVVTVTSTPLDTPKAVDYIRRNGGNERKLAKPIMCDKKGHSVVRVPSGGSVRISASPTCSNIR